MDKLSITEISALALIGTLDWEQHTPQTILCDVTLSVDTALVAQSDALHATVNYDQLTEVLRAFIGANHFQLIETLADRLAAHLLAEFPIAWIQLTVHKPHALSVARNISVTVERTQAC